MVGGGSTVHGNGGGSTVHVHSREEGGRSTVHGLGVDQQFMVLAGQVQSAHALTEQNVRHR